MSVKVNKENFESIKHSSKPVLLDFYAEWCGPCRSVGPIIDEIARERGDILVGKINVDESPELAGAFKIYSIPTLVVLKDGKVVEQAVGARGRADVAAMIERHL
jgi:thioredoxin 1